MDTSLFLQSESGIRSICKLYVLSSKGTKFHPGCSHSQYIIIGIKLFPIWPGGAGDPCRLQHIESPGSIPSRALFSRRGWIFFLFYFETWISDSFAYYLFSSYLFFDEIHVKCKQNFFGRSNSASIFLLGHPNRQRRTVYTDKL